MKWMKKLAAGVSALALCASMTASAIGTALPAAAVDTNNDDWLHAVGSRLYDSEGNEVWLTGANWFGLNCSENAPHGLYATEADPFLKAVADRGINVIRFPVSSELLISWMDGEPLEVSSVQCWGDETQGFNVEFLEADGKTTKNSLEIFEILLEKCKKYGLKCFIDVHSPHSDNSGHDWPLWYGKAGVTTESWIESLVWTADHFKNNDTVLGYDLENEPHGKGQDGENAAKWDGSTDENNWAYAATRCAEAILDVNPNALIFIEGVEQSLSGAMPGDYWGIGDRRDNSPYIGAWWGGNLRGVKDYPVVPKQGTSQIVYSPHDYGPVVYRQEWFKKNFTEETLLDDYWRDSWAYINEQDIAPLLIGELGGKLPKGADLESYVDADASAMDDLDKNVKWMILLRNYMINHHINHTFWCLNPNSGDTEGLLSNDFKTWDEEKYGLMEPALWQTASSGKYIGLDHEVPLGGEGSTTGINVAEYYKSYAASEGSNLDAGGKTDPKQPTTFETDETTESTEATEQTEETPGPTIGTTVTTPTSDVTPDGNVIYGDVDENGVVELLDVILLNKSLLGIEQLSEQANKNADVDVNQKIDGSDSLYILKYTVSLVDSFPIQ